jgi:hypothetical protein
MGRDDSPLRGRMIFVVGARRSGTYWLQRIVTSHPQVAAVPSETHLFSHGVAPLFERLQHGVRSSPQVGAVYADRDAAADAMRSLCDVIFTGFLEAGTTHVSERTPLHVMHLDLIAEIYPDARFVHIIRDARDVARSLAAHAWGPGSVNDAAREWRDSVMAARRAELPAESYREIAYERLATEPEAMVEALYEWLGLPCPSEILEAALAESRVGANLGPDPDVGTEKWRRQLSTRDVATIERVAGDLLEELGYRLLTAEPERRGRAAPARSILERLRAATGRIRARLAGRRRRPPVALFEHQTEIDRVIALIQAGDLGQLAGRLTDDVRVRVVSGRGLEEARGPDGLALLGRAINEGSQGRPVRGDTFASIPTSGVVLSNEAADGTRHDRLFFLTLAGSRFSELTLYQMPLDPRA